MPSGILEVLLVDAKGLAKTECFGKMDPYVVIHYKNQERKSSVARRQGVNPVWNEKFNFRVDYPGADDQYKLTFKIMDKDTFSKDDFVGEATIYVKDVLALGVEKGTAELKTTKYRVTLADRTYRGEIRAEEREDQDYGGWKHSAY
ncbi:calcium-dependent lipid-binding (CaLB domain) family protein isoform X2 [Tasmannia lanceolata]|uniref:calcium-dependent lipid-binding (CaLB domain) family protein isoform X2 n=1 Tax=Tasmannia lanceolata TaxID=3420 RepID=UPI004064A2F0